MVTTLAAEGWCTDPYGVHEARWLSAGTPTALVRDQGIESRDPAPIGRAPFSAEPIFWGQQGAAGTDLLRSDQAVTSRSEATAHICSMMLRGGSD
jgi:hypothetical protein